MAFERKPYKKQWNGRSNQSSSIVHPSSRIKRGKLAPLMTEEEKSTANIQQLSFDFACRITRLFQYLTDPVDYRSAISDERYKDNHSSLIDNPSSVHEREFIISKQVMRSGTSIGANVREAQHAQSDADFLSKMSIAYKEADETDYWLTLLHCNGYISEEANKSLNHDMVRILKLLTAITKSTKQKIENAKNQ